MVVRPIALQKILMSALGFLLSLPLLTFCATSADPSPTTDAGQSEPGAVWHSIFDDLSALVLAGWAAGDDDAFFVGEDGLVLRYQQSRWYQLEVPTHATLWWVWGTSPSNIYVTGEQGTLLHFNGQQWRSIDTALDESQTIWGIWGATDDDLWLVGGNAQTNGPGFVLRSDGTHLEQLALGETLPNLFKVWGHSQDDVYLVGDKGLVIRIQMDVADIQYLRPADGRARVESLFTVDGNSSGTLFAVGGVTSGLVFEKKAESWVFHDLKSQGLNGVAISEAGDAYVVGLAGTIRRHTNGHWLNEDYALDRHYHSAVLMGDTVFAVGGDLLSPKAERRGLVAARGAVVGGSITWVPGADGGVIGNLVDASTSVLDGGPLDASYFSDGGDSSDDSGGPEPLLDSGIIDASVPDASVNPPLPGPSELCTPELECAAATECWFIQGEAEDRCVTPCDTADQCPAVYGANPQCASPGCQTLYTVCMPATWVGCL